MTRRRIPPASTAPSRLTQLLIASGVAALTVVVLVVAGALWRDRGQGSDSGTPPEAGIPVERNVMGSPNAPLTLVEYSDFQ